MRYKLVVFDFDGTLADSFPWFLGAVDGMADRHGIRRIDASEVDTLRGLDARRIMARLQVPMWKVPFLARDMHRRMAEDIDQIRLFEGIAPMLKQLAERGVTVAILTSNSAENVRKILGEDEMAHISHFLCGTSLFGKGAKLKRLLKQVPVQPAEVLCVGDEIRDIEAARAAGLPCGAVAWGYTTVEALQAHAPDELFLTPQAMAERLLAG